MKWHRLVRAGQFHALSWPRSVPHSNSTSAAMPTKNTQQMSSKGKARADDVQETDDDAYGSDDPSYLLNARAGDDREEDEAIQGSPKGHKRSRLNSAGEGVHVPIKSEKIKTLFEPLVRDTDGCAVTALPVILSPLDTYPCLLVMFQAQSFAFNCTTFLPTITSNSVQVLISI